MISKNFKTIGEAKEFLTENFAVSKTPLTPTSFFGTQSGVFLDGNPIEISRYTVGSFGKVMNNALRSETAEVKGKFSFGSFTYFINQLENAASTLTTSEIFEGLAEHFNNATQKWLDVYATKPTKSIFAFTAYSEGVHHLLGFGTKFKYLPHEELVSKIEGILGNKSVHLGEKALKVYLKEAIEDKTRTSVRVVNGHSGYHALSVSVILKVGEEEIEINPDFIKLSDGTLLSETVLRHFDSIGEGFKKVNDVFEFVKTFQLEERLMAVDNVLIRKWFASLEKENEFKEKEQEFFESVLAEANIGKYDFEDILVAINTRNKRGLKQVVGKFLDLFVNKCVEGVNGG